MSEAELLKLTKSRTAARGWVTRASHAMTNILATDPVDQVELTDAVDEYDKRLKNLDSVQEDIEILLDQKDLEENISEAGDFRDQSRKARIQAAKVLANLQKKAKSEADTSHNVGAENSVKLPKLELPKFKGNLTEWQTFWDKFQALVHESNLSVISKFTYLHSLLEGEALALVQGIAIMNDNYEKACHMLEDRFGRKERIIFAHIQGLLNVTMPNPCGKGSRVSNLWKLQDELLSHIRSLESLGIRGEDYGVFLTPVILSRLPNDIRMEWARDGAGKESNLEWLLEFLRKEIERRERSETFKEVTVGKTDKPDHSAQEEKRSKSRIPTVSALQSSTGDTGCGFCGRRHATEKCWDVLELPIPERQQRILEAKLCFRCLCKGHIAKGCIAKCSKCNGRHHQLCCKGNVNHGNSKASGEAPSLHEKSN